MARGCHFKVREGKCGMERTGGSGAGCEGVEVCGYNMGFFRGGEVRDQVDQVCGGGRIETDDVILRMESKIQLGVIVCSSLR